MSPLCVAVRLREVVANEAVLPVSAESILRRIGHGPHLSPFLKHYLAFTLSLGAAPIAPISFIPADDSVEADATVNVRYDTFLGALTPLNQILELCLSRFLIQAEHNQEIRQVDIWY